MLSRLMKGLEDISDELASLSWNKRRRDFTQHLRSFRLASILSKLDDNAIKSLPLSFLRYTINTTLNEKPQDSTQTKMCISHLNTQEIVSINSSTNTNKRSKINYNSDQLEYRLPVSIVSLIFTFVEPGTILGSCYLVNRYFQYICTLPTSYNRFMSNCKKAYHNLGILVPSLISYVPKLYLDYGTAAICSEILTHISKQSTQRLKELTIRVDLKKKLNINLSIPSLTSLHTLTIERSYLTDEYIIFDLNVLTNHPSLKNVTLLRVRQIIDINIYGEPRLTISPLMENLRIEKSMCYSRSGNFTIPIFDICNAINLYCLDIPNYNLIGLCNCRTKLQHLRINTLLDSFSSFSPFSSLKTLILEKSCDLLSLMSLLNLFDTNLLPTLPVISPMYPLLSQLMVNIQDYDHGVHICNTIIKECPNLWNHLALINGDIIFNSFSSPIDNKTSLASSIGYLCYTSSEIILCSLLTDCSSNSVIIKVRVYEPLHALLNHCIEVINRNECKLSTTKGIFLEKLCAASRSIIHPGLVETKQISLFNDKTYVTADQLLVEITNIFIKDDSQSESDSDQDEDEDENI